MSSVHDPHPGFINVRETLCFLLKDDNECGVEEMEEGREKREKAPVSRTSNQ